MSKNKTRIIAGLLGVAGAVLAFFSVRSFIRWRQQSAHNETYQARTRARLERRQVEGVEGVPVQGTRYQPQDQPDRQPIPATGPSTPAAMESNVMEMTNDMIDSRVGVDMEDQVNALVQYLFAFHDMIEQMRSRRREGEGEPRPGMRSLNTTDRSMIQDTLDRLEDRLANYGQGNVEGNALQDRVYRLTVKVRDSLQNLTYSDDDLFRINGEVKTEVCKILDEVKESGVHTDENFHRVRWTYECDTSLNG